MSATEKERLQAELAILEAEWKLEQERFLVKGPDGTLVERRPVSVTNCIALMVGSVIGMAFLSATSLPIYVTYLGMIPFGLGTFRLMIGSSKAESFERFRTAYETRRGALLRKLHALEEAS